MRPIAQRSMNTRQKYHMLPPELEKVATELRRRWNQSNGNRSTRAAYTKLEPRRQTSGSAKQRRKEHQRNESRDSERRKIGDAYQDETGITWRIAGENDADEATVSRRQKPAKLVLNEPPLPGDRAVRPPMEIVRHRKQKPI
uniref:Uncharacterized protein n=1 Tax=Brassica campestris TaxID=3711 RepID=M4E2Y8_BRACM